MASDNKRELTGIILFFLAIILTLMFFLPQTVTGLLGTFLRSIGFGLLGSVALILPFFLFYAAIDFFLEKRDGVAPIRVKSIIVLVLCVSALLTSFTLDFGFFRTLCVNPEGKFTATKAIKLLWDSGLDGKMITPASYTRNAIPGGILGGGIALGLNALCGKTVTIILLIAASLSQIILIFHISVKKTAKAIGSATATAYRQVKNYRNDSISRRPVNQANPQAGRTEIYKPSPIVRNAQGQLEVPIIDGNSMPDPFRDTRMPVDSASGFVDTSNVMPDGFSRPSESDVLSYNDKTVRTAQNSNGADFSFDPGPKNPPLQDKKQRKELSFLKKNKEPSFYDLEGSDRDGLSEYKCESMTPSYEPREGYGQYESDDDDEIYEINGTGSEAPSVREPNVDLSQIGASVDRNPNKNFLFEQKPEASSSRSDIRINSEKDMNELRAADNRVAVNPSSSVPAPSEPKFASSEAAPVKRKKYGPYKPAPTSLLALDTSVKNANNDAELRAKAVKLEEALRSFGISAQVINITHGPTITRFELSLATGTKVSKVTNLADDIQLALAAVSVRIEAPIPGKSAVGIEIPNDKSTAVHLRGLLDTKEFRESSKLTVALGRDIPGKPILCDLTKMPHLLIAGSTGSGKSVCINSILSSILCKASPDEVKLILIDPKVVELSVYNGIPHLVMPVVTDCKKAANTLGWAVKEMTRRYELFAKEGVRDVNGYNEYVKLEGEEPLPLVVIIIDELADLMTVAAKEVEGHIARLTALARAAGLHLIVATQRPSVDVITGVIKNNIPSRIAFAVSSGPDSRTILDSVGAEKLLGKGDMLYAPISATKPIRGQGGFVSDDEVEKLVGFLRTRYGSNYDEAMIKQIESASVDSDSSSGSSDMRKDSSEGGDDMLDAAVETVIEQGVASVSILQRRLGIGYPRAARLIDVMEQKHIVGPFEGSKPRKVLITQTDWLEIKARGDNK